MALPWRLYDVVTMLQTETHPLQTCNAHWFKIWPLRNRMAFKVGEPRFLLAITMICHATVALGWFRRTVETEGKVRFLGSAFITRIADSRALQKVVPKIGDWGQGTVVLKLEKVQNRTNKNRKLVEEATVEKADKTPFFLGRLYNN